MTTPSRREWVFVVLVMFSVLSACGPAAYTAASCNDEFARRADSVNQVGNADKIDWLAELIRACGTTDQWMSAAAAYPNALLGGDPMRLLDTGCAAPELGDEPLCRDGGP
jgi:hypothetical protein